MNKHHKISEQALEISSIAIKAVLYEASAAPKPGLVTPVSNGAHSDMDFFKFIDSACALIPFFCLFAQTGFDYSDPKDIFERNRQIGICAEKAMFEATEGINTHKGMIFLMALACGAVAKIINEGLSIEDAPKIISAMTYDIVEKDFKDLDKKENLSNGEKLYLKYRLKGVRGEAAAGLPAVFKHGLPFYNKYGDLTNTLLHIISVCEDTTIVHRHSIEMMHYVRQRSLEVLRGDDHIKAIENEFIQKNISPGGSADLLALTVFFSEIGLLLS